MSNGSNNSKPKKNTTTIVWFRNDQRIMDNPILYEAGKLKADTTICVYCFDPRHYETTKFGSLKTNSFRCNFLMESIRNLRANIRSKLGSDLLVSFGRPEELIPKLCQKSGDKSVIVLVQHEDAWEELKVEKAVEKGIVATGCATMKTFHGATLFHRDDLPYDTKSFRDIPDGFTSFKNKVESKCSIRKLFSYPKKGILKLPANKEEIYESIASDSTTMGFNFLPTETMLGLKKGALEEIAGKLTDRGGVLNFEGGETAGRKRLQEWMFDQDRLKEYFEIRNGMLGEGYSSKFSPWLATGNISPRWIHNECKRYEKERGIANKSTYWLIFELIWRDFFHFLLPKYGRRVFYPYGMKGSSGGKNWSTDRNCIEKWKTGTTGMPLVDANMRELAQTGWMSNRGRQNVASYLVIEMGIDWRIGADHFESLLLDHDVYSNYGNWNSAAGLAGGRINKFNTVKQSKDYDPKGDYIRHWIPELSKVPAPLIFEPWKMNQSQQEKYGVKIKSDYPSPIKLGAPRMGGVAGSSRNNRGGGNGGGRNNKERRNNNGGRGGGSSNNNGNNRRSNKGGNNNSQNNRNSDSNSSVPSWFNSVN